MPFAALAENDPAFARRGAAASATVILHLIAFALILWLASPGGNAVADQTAITTFDVEQDGPASPEPPQEEQVETPPTPPEPVIVPVAEIILPSENDMPVAIIEQAAAAGSGGGCDLTATVQTALQAEPDIERTLPTISRERRSSANALALWKGAWVEPDALLPAEALDAIRDTMALAVAAAPDACRMQMLSGPRFIYLPGPGRTTVLAMGSGKWSWQEVVDTPDDAMMAETSPDGRTSKPRPRNRLESLLSDIFQR
ncbi:MAG: hypothetical protein WA948_03670 [Pontixanthobacter sp.]